jgi:predicted Rossmann-fold nucleotide-binding protein
MLTWNTLKIHSKKIILLNCAHFYDHLVGHIMMMQEQGFLYEDWKDRLIICSTAQEAINVLS